MQVKMRRKYSKLTKQEHHLEKHKKKIIVHNTNELFLFSPEKMTWSVWKQPSGNGTLLLNEKMRTAIIRLKNMSTEEERDFTRSQLLIQFGVKRPPEEGNQETI